MCEISKCDTRNALEKSTSLNTVRCKKLFFCSGQFSEKGVCLICRKHLFRNHFLKFRNHFTEVRFCFKLTLIVWVFSECCFFRPYVAYYIVVH